MLISQKIDRNSLAIILILIASIVIRLLYAKVVPQIALNADSYGYYNLGTEILQKPQLSTIISQYRTPLYPLFVATIMKTMGAFGNSVGTAEFNYASGILMLVQIFLAITAILAFYHMLVLIGFSATLAATFTLFLSFNISLFAWERMLITDGPAIALTLFITYQAVKTLKYPKGFNFFWLALLFGLGFLLRPALMFLAVIILPIIVYRYHQKSVIIMAALTLAGFSLLPFTYIKLNQIYHGYAGIQHVGDIDLLGRILQFRHPIESGKKYSYFYNTVNDYRTRRGEPMPFWFLETYDPDIYTNTSRMVELQGFVRTVIMHNLPSHFWKSLVALPHAFWEQSEFIKITPIPGNNLSYLFSALQKFYYAIRLLSFVSLFLYPVTIYLFIRRPNFSNSVLMTMGSLAIIQIFLISSVVYDTYFGEYERLTVVVQPQLFLFCFLWILKLKESIFKYLINHHLIVGIN